VFLVGGTTLSFACLLLDGSSGNFIGDPLLGCLEALSLYQLRVSDLLVLFVLLLNYGEFMLL
jgi:hypothetical protein